ncbi:hypothetical protein F4823DRAFT_216534 [Ustulina deusta]|nr:hypothetical protein F4823DRAFT_216534 [Ustulina deusta]
MSSVEALRVQCPLSGCGEKLVSLADQHIHHHLLSRHREYTRRRDIDSLTRDFKKGATISPNRAISKQVNTNRQPTKSPGRSRARHIEGKNTGYSINTLADTGANINTILSLDVGKESDVFHRHENPSMRFPRPALPGLFGICGLPEGNETHRNLAEEFLSDFKSPEPFTYSMVVRESARQSEIQRKIKKLPPENQATQLVIEQKRIDSWKRIQNAKEKGDDWSRLRDEYLSSLQPGQLSWLQDPTFSKKTTFDSCDTKNKGFRRWRSRNPSQDDLIGSLKKREGSRKHRI